MMTRPILIIGAGVLQVPIVAIARQYGPVMVTDRDPRAPAVARAEGFFNLDIYDAAGHADLVRELKPRAIFCAAINAEVTCATASQAAGLRCYSAEAALNCKEKDRTRACLEQAGIPQPRSFLAVEYPADANRAVETLGYPLAFKAIDNSGGRGLTRVQNWREIWPAWEKALGASRKRFYYSEAEAWVGGCLIEEWLSGPEQSVEIIVEGQEWHPVNVVDRVFREDLPWVEWGHVSPSRLDPVTQQELYELAWATARAVGVDWGVFKIDTMLTERGPVVLECTARLSGGFDSTHTARMGPGLRSVEAALQLALGERLRDIVAAGHLIRRDDYCYAACAGVFPDWCGPVRGVTGAGPEVYVMPWAYSELRPIEASADRPAYALAAGDTWDEAWRKAVERAAQVKFWRSE